MFVFNESITSWLPSPLVIDYVDLKEKHKQPEMTPHLKVNTGIIGISQNLKEVLNISHNLPV